MWVSSCLFSWWRAVNNLLQTLHENCCFPLAPESGVDGGDEDIVARENESVSAVATDLRQTDLDASEREFDDDDADDMTDETECWRDSRMLISSSFTSSELVGSDDAATSCVRFPFKLLSFLVRDFRLLLKMHGSLSET